MSKAASAGRLVLLVDPRYVRREVAARIVLLSASL
jgi:hypothetical protein